MPIDCVIIEDDEMSVLALTEMIGQMEQLNLVGTFKNPVQAIEFLQKRTVDLLFLDVEMPEMTGFDLIKSLDIKTNLIFMSSHKKYAIDAFDYNVVDYLIKPITLPRFMKAIGKITATHDNLIPATGTNEKEYFFLKKDSVLDKVPAKDILWVEALGDYITVHTLNKKYILHLSMKSMENKLCIEKFVRVHRSYIVNVENIKSVEDSSIYINNTPIPIGAMYRDNFLTKLNLLS